MRKISKTFRTRQAVYLWNTDCVGHSYNFFKWLVKILQAQHQHVMSRKRWGWYYKVTTTQFFYYFKICMNINQFIFIIALKIYIFL